MRVLWLRKGREPKSEPGREYDGRQWEHAGTAFPPQLADVYAGAARDV